MPTPNSAESTTTDEKMEKGGKLGKVSVFAPAETAVGQLT